MKEKFSIEGMTCVNCSSRIERVVGKQKGVNLVTVNLLGNYMVVEYNKDDISEDRIIEIVNNAGFKAKKYERGLQGDKEIKNLKKRVCISFIFLIFLMFLSMQHMLGYKLPDIFNNYLVMSFSQLVLTIPIIFVNRSYFIKGIKNLFSKEPNMDTLVAVGSGAAFIYGIFVICRFIFGSSSLLNPLYFESSGMILTLVTLGKFLEGRSKKFTGDAIEKLIELTPKVATLINGEEEKIIDINEVKINDLLLIKPGERIPTDGTIVEGMTFVNQSMITGESIPVYKAIDDSVIGGTINENGVIKIKVDKVLDDTVLSQIVRLVEDANSTKAPIGRLADKISKFFVPTVIGIAFISAVIWLILGESFEFALDILISVLVISCPCALGLATPVAIMVGTGVGAKNGILIKSAEKLEIAHKIDTVIMDKTGTVTKGELQVTDLLGNNTDSYMSLIYSLEKFSEHPIARAVVKYCKENNITSFDVENFENILGYGISGFINGKKYFCGNLKFLESNNIGNNKFCNEVDGLLESGKTLLYLSNEKEVLGVIAVMDTIKEDSKDAISKMKKMGIKTVMATGDNIKVASFVSKEIKTDCVEAEVLPQDKEKIVLKYQENSTKVAMVGDGINDAPALVKSDLGIAIGSGTDIAIDSADVILTNNSLNGVVNLIELSRKVVNNIKMNLFWAFFYNSLGIPIAAGVFYNLVGLKLNPMIAATAMSLSSVCVVLNALRLKKFKGR